MVRIQRATAVTNGMKILIATPLYPPEVGGPATHTLSLERELPKHGIDVSTVAFRDVRHLPKIIRHIVYFAKVLKRGKETELIYALDPVSVGLPALFASRILKKRFIVRIAGDYAWEQGVQRFNVSDSLDDFYNSENVYLYPVMFLKWLQKYVANSAEKVIVPSEYLKEIVSEWVVPKEKITVVYSSLEKSKMAGNKKTLRGLLHFNGKLIVSAGRLVPWKGFDTLIEIMPAILKKVPDATLFILGDGPDGGVLEEKIQKRGLEGKVILGGSVTKNILLRYVEAADLFVLNTSYEGFSHQLLEVMDAGTPIITTNVGGNPELITNGKDGILVPYNSKKALVSAIEEVLTTPALSKELAASAKRTVLRFSEERMVQVLIAELQ